MTLALQELSTQEQAMLMRHNPDKVLWTLKQIVLHFDVPMDALLHELAVGRIHAVAAGIEREPCISAKAFMDWMRNPQTPEGLKVRVMTWMRASRARM